MLLCMPTIVGGRIQSSSYIAACTMLWICDLPPCYNWHIIYQSITINKVIYRIALVFYMNCFVYAASVTRPIGLINGRIDLVIIMLAPKLSHHYVSWENLSGFGEGWCILVLLYAFLTTSCWLCSSTTKRWQTNTGKTLSLSLNNFWWDGAKRRRFHLPQCCNHALNLHHYHHT